MRDLKELLLESGCSSEFILDAMRFEHLFTGDIDAFLDKVEDILMNEEEYEDDLEDDEDSDEDEDDPIYQSDYNYDGNEDNIYFEDEDGEEAFDEDDEDEE
jgi:6,7-dimethyl-8-ribityllumazine synthase